MISQHKAGAAASELEMPGCDGALSVWIAARLLAAEMKRMFGSFKTNPSML